MLKLNAKELRGRKPTEEELASIKRRPIYIVLDNVLDTYNIGGLFRLADSVAASQVILCGQSETPPSSRIHKAAVGTEEWVAWRYSPTALEYLQEFKIQNARLQMPEHSSGGQAKCKIVAVEQSKKSISYTEIDESPITNHPSPITHHSSPIAVVVGHETEGVSKDVLDVADVIVELPMFGVNKSLNVIVSAAIVLYKILEQWE